MVKDISIVPVVTKEGIDKPVKIIESAKKRGSKVSLATKVDAGFIGMLANEQNNIGKFIDLEIDPTTNIMTIHFERLSNSNIEEKK